ncbi:MAG: hypothetical protein GKR86_00155 [Ilumatobacter sp.]|nr:hypothetical protein [Ilumatobacter sp.]
MGFVRKVVGKITGSDAAADAQAGAARQQGRIADQSAKIQKEMFNQTREDLSPFMQAGKDAIPALQQTLNPMDRTAALSQYFQGPEYQMMQEQAQRNQLAASEAMGGLGATSTSNALAGIAPQLGMQHLSGLEAANMDQYNRAMGLVNLGQSSAARTGAAAQNYASGAAQALGQKSNAVGAMGQAGAMKSMAPMQTMMQLGGMAMGAMSGGMF